MIVINNCQELTEYKKQIDNTPKTNYQQTYENLYAIHNSNETAVTFIYKDIISTFTRRDDNIFECSLNIEPLIFNKINKDLIEEFIYEIKKYLKKTIYFPLVYEDSEFYKLMKNKIYNYERLYTSISNHNKIGNDILNYILNSNRVFFSNRNVKKFEKNMYIKYISKEDVKDILIEIESNSWKKEKKQDMTTKIEQLNYYNKLVEQGIASIAIAYEKNTNDLVAYRLDAIYSNKISVLKNSYKEEYKKYSPGSYMLLYDLFYKYPYLEYVDLYGGPGLAKQMIETDRIKRFDFVIGNKNIVKDLESKRKKWDKKNYDNYIEGKSIKEVFNKKENVLAVTSVFGLGPVGKLSAIVSAGKDEFNWFAAGEEFDINIFNENVFKDKCFTMDKDMIKDFINKYNIKYAVVVLKNKMARLLLELGIKVVYVDSLPFMWSQEDANTGKVPYLVDCYCAQKTIELSKKSQEIFSKVRHLQWINPIVNEKINENKQIKEKNYVLINLGGLHSPATDGNYYIEIVLKTLLDIYSKEHIIITTSTKSRALLEKILCNYEKIKIKTLKQEEFYSYIKNAKEFFTSPGLTTIIEATRLRDKIIYLPPQNLSQFYNINYGKKNTKYYKEITWNSIDLTLEGLEDVLKKDEHGVIDEINKRIKEKNNTNFKTIYKNYIKNILENNFIKNEIKSENWKNGSLEVIESLRRVVKNDKEEKNISS